MPIIRAPVSLPARLRLPAGLLAQSSSSHTEHRLRPKMYNLAAFLQRRRPEKWPTRLPCPRTFLPWEHPAAPAQYFPAAIPRPACTKGSPLPPAHDGALFLRSCTTRRANLQPGDGSSGILRLGASPESPWPRAASRLHLPDRSWDATTCLITRVGSAARPLGAAQR
jgi:hypothetical protein